MNRSEMLHELQKVELWDFIIIGGGATGLGIAVDAASRGYKTLLIEQQDFGSGTSSRSTKLVHGGVRYLAQGNIKLVREALQERGFLLKNAPHLTHKQTFIIPTYKKWKKWYYGIGLKIYEWLSGRRSLGKTKILHKHEVMQALPAVHQDGLQGGVLYYDGQFDDARLCIDLAATATLHGAVLLNYCCVEDLIKERNKIIGVTLHCSYDSLTQQVYAKSVINATGVFTDALQRLDNPETEQTVTPSQGIHLVVDASFFPGKHAMMIPETDDGRVLFAVPWHDKIILGTTDTPVDTIPTSPQPLQSEIDFIMHHFNRYTNQTIEKKDVLSMFAGLRPLIKSKANKKTAMISREHAITVSAGGMVSVTGGKWTTYRRMAEETLNNAIFVSKQGKRICVTKHLPIGDPLARQQIINRLIQQDTSLQEQLHPGYPYTLADVVYAVRYEMAVTAEDVLSRRTRLLFLDAQAAIDSVDKVLSIMQAELQKDTNWSATEKGKFIQLAQKYLII